MGSALEWLDRVRQTVRALRGPAAALRSAISLRIVSALMLIAVVAGCGGLPRTPLPVDHMLDAQIPGIPGIRSFGMKHSPAFQANLVQSIQAEREDVY